MEINPEQNILIDQYLDGNLSKEDEAAFELALKNDPGLFKQYCFETDLRDSLAEMEFKKSFPEIDLDETILSESASSLKKLLLKNTMKPGGENPASIHLGTNLNENDKSTLPQAVKLISNRRWIKIAAAASVTGLVISLIWVNNKTSPPPLVDTEKKVPALIKDSSNSLANNSEKTAQWYSDIFDAFFDQDKVPDEKPLSLLADLENFKNNNYTIQNFDADNPPTVRDMGNEDDKLNSRQHIKELGHYYKGLSYISTNNPGLARTNLQWVIDNAKDENIKIKAQWYLALNNVKYADTAGAMPILNALSMNKKAYRYSEKAAQLSIQLKQ